MAQTNNWFKDWFNSPYYHKLYHKRDESEAVFFLNNLLNHLNTPKEAEVLDLACGKGRHSIYLNSLGYSVTGLDLSEESIEHARRFENEHLSFFVHDMRRVFRVNYFDLVLNLFTSFGYFNTVKEDLDVLHAVHSALKPNGYFVLDYLNTPKVLENLVAKEHAVIDNISFDIERKLEDGFILKIIKVTDGSKDFTFSERVKALTKKDFEEYFFQKGLKIQETFGDYALNPFTESSNRLIIIAKK